MTILIQKTIPKLCALSSIMQRPLSQVQSGAYLKTKYLPLCFLPPYQIWYFFKLLLSYIIAKKLSSEMVIQHILQMSTLLIRKDEISIVLFSFIKLYCVTYLENSRRAYWHIPTLTLKWCNRCTSYHNWFLFQPFCNNDL